MELKKDVLLMVQSMAASLSEDIGLKGELCLYMGGGVISRVLDTK